MNTTISIKTALFSVALAFGLAFGIIFGLYSQVQASAPSGLQATIATSSNPTVGTTAVTVFATSTCAARIITTYANPIMITFSDNQGKIPTATYGHLQAASTTIAYDSGQYGCGLVRVYGYGSNTAITVSESR